MERTARELRARWRDDWNEASSDGVKNMLDPLLMGLKVWYRWHKTIYAGQVTMSNEEIQRYEVENGIDFRRCLG